MKEARHPTFLMKPTFLPLYGALLHRFISWNISKDQLYSYILVPSILVTMNAKKQRQVTDVDFFYHPRIKKPTLRWAVWFWLSSDQIIVSFLLFYIQRYQFGLAWIPVLVKFRSRTKNRSISRLIYGNY